MHDAPPAYQEQEFYMYNTADQNKVFWLHDLKDAYQAYVTCKDAIDETVGEEPAVSAEGYIKGRKRRRHLEGSESEPKMPRLCPRCANEEYRYVYKCKYEHTLEMCRHWDQVVFDG